jgi:hypothetical protein
MKDLLTIRTNNTQLIIFKRREVSFEELIDLEDDVDFYLISETRVNKLLLTFTMIEHELLETHVVIYFLLTYYLLHFGAVEQLRRVEVLGNEL